MNIGEAIRGGIEALKRHGESEARRGLELALIALEELAPAELDLPLEVEE